MWNAEKYDEWYKAFHGGIEDHVDWELLKKFLPENRDARILDAAGGTGRITLRLAKMGYSPTLCDLSPDMLKVTKQKMRKNGVLEKVKILKCDIRNLPFDDDSFDFVLCWDGSFEARKELIRVTGKRGRISVFLVNKWSYAINNFYKNPDSSLALVESSPGIVEDKNGPYTAVSEKEAGEIFKAEGIRVIDIFAVCGWTDVLPIPEKILKSRSWDEKFFKQTAEMVLKLSKEPSVKGMTRHLVLYGEKL